MKTAADFRSVARNALPGRWGISVVAGLIASLLGAVSSNKLKIELNFGDSGGNVNIGLSNQQIQTTNGGWTEVLIGFVAAGVVFIILATLVVAIARFFLGSIVGLGYSKFNLELVDRQKEPKINTLFGYFKHWKTAVVASFLRGLYVSLWTLCFIVPGIIAGYSYAMTNYILAENPELTPGEAIERSKSMMAGNRWRLFCLQFSFIGWDLLCTLTLGIGDLWLRPYKQAAEAAFYREVSGTEDCIA